MTSKTAIPHNAYRQKTDNLVHCVDTKTTMKKEEYLARKQKDDADVKTDWQKVWQQKEGELAARIETVRKDCKDKDKLIEELALRAEIRDHWQTKWDDREKTVAAEKRQLQIQCEQTANTVKQLSEDLQNVREAQKKEQAKILIDQELAEVSKSWQRKWHQRQEEHHQEVAQLTSRVGQAKSSQAESSHKWEDRWAARQKEVAAQAAARREEHQWELDLLMKEHHEAFTTVRSEMAAAAEANVTNLQELTAVKVELLEKEAHWNKKCSTLEGLLQAELVAKERATQLLLEKEAACTTTEAEWVEERRRMDLTVQEMNEKILRLSDLAHKTDKEKAQMLKAEKKAAKKAAKQQARERGETVKKWWQFWK